MSIVYSWHEGCPPRHLRVKVTESQRSVGTYEIRRFYATGYNSLLVKARHKYVKLVYVFQLEPVAMRKLGR